MMTETLEMDCLRRSRNISRFQHVRNEDIRRQARRKVTTFRESRIEAAIMARTRNEDGRSNMDKMEG
nr:unnamed protein product [Callosobruchus chinensis]